jgi:hypothetical protein
MWRLHAHLDAFSFLFDGDNKLTFQACLLSGSTVLEGPWPPHTWKVT